MNDKLFLFMLGGVSAVIGAVSALCFLDRHKCECCDCNHCPYDCDDDDFDDFFDDDEEDD